MYQHDLLESDLRRAVRGDVGTLPVNDAAPDEPVLRSFLQNEVFVQEANGKIVRED